MCPIPWISREEALPSPILNPDPDPNYPGIIAATSDLNVNRLIEAYPQGMFPWYSEGEPILWWSTNPRMVLHTSEFKASHSLKKIIRAVLLNSAWEIRVNHDFPSVIQSCAAKTRPGQHGTWITQEIMEAYIELHRIGHAHSIETWFDNKLVGGLYCVNFGRMVFGESMFADYSNASKLALASLCAWGASNQISMIDCQQETNHLKSLGGKSIPREVFLNCVSMYQALPKIDWVFDKNVLNNWL